MPSPTTTTTTNALIVHRHQSLLLRLAVLSRAVTFLLLQLTVRLPLFDASPLLVSAGRPFLRWDTFHFLHVAEQGYAYEHEWAFFPGVPIVMHAMASLVRLVHTSEHRSDLLLGGVAAAVTCDTTRTLYALSLHHLQSPQLAFLASLLSLLPSSPVTLQYAPYSEPFFTYFSYKGMLSCAREQWILAALFFAIAGSLRSNGIFLSGFLLWGMVIQPYLQSGKMASGRLAASVGLTALVTSPFIYHHYAAFAAFCTTPVPHPDWCDHIPPSIYTHVQSKYWNVGFFRYWAISQIPNFLIAAPPLLGLCAFSAHYLTRNLRSRLCEASSDEDNDPFLRSSITPHILHATLLCVILLFASHTQIVLRLAASMPATYWAAVWLMFAHPVWGFSWVFWSFLWGLIAIILWGVFLPPA